MRTKHYEPLTKRQSSMWKAQKNKYQKSMSAEIKSENHVHFLQFEWDYPKEVCSIDKTIKPIAHTKT